MFAFALQTNTHCGHHIFMDMHAQHTHNARSLYFVRIHVHAHDGQYFQIFSLIHFFADQATLLLSQLYISRLCLQSSYSGLQDLLQPSSAAEARKHKLRRLVQSPNSFFMDVRCPGCYQMWVAVHSTDNVTYDVHRLWFDRSVIICISPYPLATTSRAFDINEDNFTHCFPHAVRLCSATPRPPWSARSATPFCASRLEERLGWQMVALSERKPTKRSQA